MEAARGFLSSPKRRLNLRIGALLPLDPRERGESIRCRNKGVGSCAALQLLSFRPFLLLFRAGVGRKRRSTEEGLEIFGLS